MGVRAVFPPFVLYETTFESDFWIQQLLIQKKPRTLASMVDTQEAELFLVLPRLFGGFLEGFWVQLHPCSWWW